MLVASVAAQTPVSSKTPVKLSAANVDEVLKAMRAELQSTRADVMAKNMTVTSEQAAKFWPVFEAYQKEQNVIMDEHLEAIQKYVASYDTLTDASAAAFMDAHLRGIPG